MRTLDAQDTISGKEGVAYVQVNGNNEELFFAKTIEAKVEKTKSEIKSIGRRMLGHKTTGMSGTGSMTLYYVSPLFRQMAADYKDTGKDVYFDMVVTNNDAGSAAGTQSVLLKSCNMDSTILASLDGDSDDALEEDCDFTFDDFRYLQTFN